MVPYVRGAQPHSNIWVKKCHPDYRGMNQVRANWSGRIVYSTTVKYATYHTSHPRRWMSEPIFPKTRAARTIKSSFRKRIRRWAFRFCAPLVVEKISVGICPTRGAIYY